MAIVAADGACDVISLINICNWHRDHTQRRLVERTDSHAVAAAGGVGGIDGIRTRTAHPHRLIQSESETRNSEPHAYIEYNNNKSF